MRKTIKNQKGQSLVEYLIIVAIVAIGSLGVIRVVGQNVTAKFGQVAESLQGKKSSKIKVRVVKKSHHKMRDLGNFFDDATPESKSSNQ